MLKKKKFVFDQKLIKNFAQYGYFWRQKVCFSGMLGKKFCVVGNQIFSGKIRTALDHDDHKSSVIHRR